MSVSDPIADMLIRIKNAFLVKKDSVYIPRSNLKLALAKILKEEGFIDDFEATKDDLGFEIKLKFDNNSSAISEIKRVSKPGKRVYAKKDKIPQILQGRGIVILSTSKGIMAGEEAKKKGIGGEILCKIW